MPKLQVEYYYKKKFVDFNMKNRHAHNAVEIMYVSSGQCVVDTPMGRKTVSTNQFIVLGKGVAHALKVGRGDIVNLEFFVGSHVKGFDIGRAYAQNGVAGFLSEDCRVYTDDGSVYPALRDVVRELQTTADDYAVEVLMQRLLIVCGRLYDLTVRNSGGNTYVKKAQSYIVHNCHERLTVADVACQIGINQSYLQNLFRRYANTTVVEYANRVRIEKAVFLLRNTGMDITDIALECGFASRQHFGLTFRKLMGCSPMAFRKQS